MRGTADVIWAHNPDSVGSTPTHRNQILCFVVAQLVERRTVNAYVGGSSPPYGAILNLRTKRLISVTREECVSYMGYARVQVPCFVFKFGMITQRFFGFSS